MIINQEDIGDLYTIEEFIDACKAGGFIDYDGYGNFANLTQYESSIDVYPSKLLANKIKVPTWATHILWYNR
jgi:hypothetical protein